MDVFPCQNCHSDMPPVNRKEGEILSEHTHISLKHGGLLCFDCHYSEDRDFLQTVNHRLISFSQMEDICGICHAAQYHDWQRRIHGKLVGFWNGPQQGLRCVECHDVHHPKPMVIKPEDPPSHPAAVPAGFPFTRGKKLLGKWPENKG